MNTYKSFWMGGFEGADHVNGRQQPLDMVRDSGHLRQVDRHYGKLRRLGIQTVRESVGWRSVKPTVSSSYDFTRLRLRAAVATRYEIQIIWTLMHYGTPDGVSLLDDSFIDHFAEYAREAALVIKDYDEKPVINLINEISFLAWAVSQTDYMWPYQGRYEGAGGESARLGYQVKCRLVKAVLKGLEKVREVLPNARFLHVEPLLHVVAPADRPEQGSHRRAAGPVAVGRAWGPRWARTIGIAAERCQRQGPVGALRHGDKGGSTGR